MRSVFIRTFCALALVSLALPQVVEAAGPDLSMNPGNLGAYSLGIVQIPLQSTGGTGAITWTLKTGTLPPGLSIRTDGTSFFPNDTTGSLMGVATTAGHYAFTLTATDTANPGVDFPATIDISPEYVDEAFNLPDGAKGVAYSHQLNVVQKPASSFSVSGGNLPGTFNLSSGGLLTGTPTAAGTYNFTVQFSDSLGLTLSRNLKLVVAGPTISTSGILTAAQGASVNQTFTGAGGDGGPYTFQQAGGALPNGVVFNNAAGAVNGTVNPNANPGRYSFAVKVTDSSGSYTQNFAFYVTAAVLQPLPIIQAQQLPDATIGNPYVASVAGGFGKGPYTWTVTGLPTGLSFRTQGLTTTITPGDVEIRGVPQVSGDFNVTFTATDQNGASVTQILPFHISTLAMTTATNLPGGTLNSAYTQQTMQVIGGKPGYTTTLPGPQIPQAGITVSGGGATGFTVSGMPSETGTFNFPVKISDTGGDSFMPFLSLNVQGAGNISINNGSNLGTFSTGSSVNYFLGACCVNGGVFTWSNPGGGLPAGLTLNPATGQLGGTATPQGSYSFTIQATDPSNSSHFGVKNFTIGFSDLAITNASLPFGNVGTPYSATIMTSGGNQGNLTWSSTIGLLPPGLSYSNGVFSGTPTATGAYNVKVGVSDGNNVIQKTFTINIYAAGGAPAVAITDSGALGTYPLGDFEYDLSGAAVGGIGTYTWSVANGSSLPPGLAIRTDFTEFNETTALIGVANTPGTYSFTLVATSGTQSASKQFTVKITALNVVDQGHLPAAYDGVPYSYTLTPINNAGAASYSLTNGALPSWATLTNGTISGTPTGESSANFSIAVSDGTDTIFSAFHLATHKLHISNPGRLANAMQGQTYSVTLTSTGGTGNVTFMASGLPNGLQISNGNVITGTVDSNAFPGLYTVNITATDSNSASITQTFSINVTATNAALPQISYGTPDDAVIGELYGWSFNSCCGGQAPYTWTAQGLPAGLFLRYDGSGTPGTASSSVSSYIAPGGVEIYGIAKTAGVSHVTLTMTDALGQSTSTKFDLNVSPLEIQPYLPNGTVGSAYTMLQHAAGGDPNAVYNWTTAAPSGAGFDYYAAAPATAFTGGWAGQLSGLPDGLSSSTAGVPPVRTTSGTPLESGSFTTVYLLNDGHGNTLRRTNFFTINQPAGQSITINTSSNLGGVTTNASYSNQLSAFGAASITWSVESGTLPPGITLSAGGLLSGTANTAGNYAFLVKADDSAHVVNPGYRAFTLVVTPLAITTSFLPTGIISTTYPGATLAATGGTGLTWSVGAGTQLPPGLSLDPGTGAVSGTPTSTGQYYTVFTVTDGLGNRNSRGLVTQIYPAGGPPVSITTGQHLGTFSIGELQYELDATGGIGSFNWSLTAGALPPGMALRTDGPSWFSQNASAGLIGVATTPGTYSFTLKATSGQQFVTKQFDITITALTIQDLYNLPDGYVGNAYNTYKLTALNAGGTVTFSTTQGSCAVNSTACVPPGLTLGADGSITGTPTTAGSYSFNVSVNDGTSTMSRQFNLQIFAVDITTASLPNATQGTAYDSGALTATGDTVTWSANGLPNGFSINGATGHITASSNFSAGPGRYSVTITATGSSASSIARYVLNVVGTPATLPQITVNSSNLDDATIGVPYDATFAVNNGGTAPFTYAATGLPPGLSIRSAIPVQSNGQVEGDAEVWGTATATGSYNVTITATDKNGFVTSNTFPLKVVALLQDPGLPKGTIGTAYNSNLRIVGGTGTTAGSYSVTSTVQGRLPAGLARNALNVGGTPLESGFFNITYVFTDGTNTLVHTSYFSIDNTLNNPIQINDGGDLGTVSLNAPYNKNLSACCSGSGIDWAVVNGSTLPSGLSLSTGGTLSGSPSAIGAYTFLVSATAHGTANVAYRQYTMSVVPLVLSNSTTLPFGTVGAPYSQTLSTSQLTGAVLPIQWAVQAGSFLPPGITLAAGGLLSSGGSNLAVAGHYSFTVTATDNAGPPHNVLVKTLSLDIYPAGQGPPLSFSLNSSYGPWYLAPNSIQLSASGGTPPYTFSYAPGANTIPGCRIQNGGPFPTNFSQGTTAGLLCVVNTPGSTNTTIRVTDNANATFDRQTTIIVSPLMPEMQANLPRATVGVAYTWNPTAGGGVMGAGGTGTYSYSASNLPGGLSIDSATGVISGTPTTAGNFSPSITISNTSPSQSVSVGVSLNVNAFAITSSPSLQATAGQTFTTTLTAPNCGTNCNWTVASGTLPSGFVLNGNGLLTTGNNVASPADTSFTVQASGSNGTSQQVVSMIIAPNAITALSITSKITTTAQLGFSQAVGLFAAGGTPPYTFSVSAGSLPDGITLQGTGDLIGFLAPSHQYLAGRPLTPSTYNFTLQVTDANSNTATQAYTWVVSPLNIQYGNLPLNGTSLTYNNPYSQQLLVMGGSGVYSGWTSSAPLQTGLTLSDSGLLSGTPTTTGQVSTLMSVHDNAGGTTTSNVNVNVTSSGNTTVSLGGPAAGTVQALGATQTYALNPTGGTPPYTITAVGPLPAGVILESGNSLGSTFGGSLYEMQALFSAPGTYAFTVQATDSTQGTPLVGARTYTIVVPDFTAPIITGIPAGSVGVAYSQQLYSFGGGSWAVTAGSALPPGLSISAGGLISGTPTTAGVYSFSLTVSDGTGSQQGTYTMQISPLAISSAQSLPSAPVGIPYGPGGNGVQLAGSGGTGNTTWSVTAGSLPDGLTLSATGLLSGTPTGNSNNGLYPFTVTATNSSGSIAKQFSIFQTQTNPLNLDFSLSATAMSDAIVGQNYSYFMVPDGGVPDYTWAVANGSSLPPGLSLVPATLVTTATSSGPGVTAIAGAPTAAGQYTFDLTLTDSTNATITRTFHLKVTPISITAGNPKNAVLGQPYSFQIQPTGGTGPYTFAISSSPSQLGQDLLPSGLTMDSAGLISGTPTSTGGFQFLVTVTDSAQHTLTRSLTLTCNTSGSEQILVRNQLLQITSGVNIPLGVGGSGAAFTWVAQAPSPAPASPIQPNLPPGVQLLNTQNGWVIQGPSNTPGIYQVMLKATNTGNAQDFVTKLLTISISPITTTSPVQNGLFSDPLPTATMGTAYSYTFRAAGGTAPYTFTPTLGTILPPGLTLDSATGLLSGTPTQSGVVSIKVTVTDSAGNPADVNASAALIILTPGGHAPLDFRTKINVSDASIGVPWALMLDRLVFPATGPLTWSVTSGSLPAGISILPGSNGLSPILAGTPTSVGTGVFTLHAADTNGQTLDLPVNDFNVSPMQFTPDSIPNAVKGTSYSVFVGIQGGTAPYGVQIFPGMAPPPGMTISGGLLTGTPTVAGVFPIGLRATDKNGATVTKFYDFSVDDTAGEAPSISVAPKPLKLLEIQGQSATSTSVTVSSSSGTLPFTAALYGATGATLTPNSGTTNGSMTLDYSALSAGNYAGFVAAVSPNAVNLVNVTPVNIAVVPPPPCVYLLKTSTTSSPIGGDSGTIEISTGDACTWTAAPANDSSWITLTGATSGTGSGKIPYSTAANTTGAARTGTVNITGSTNSPVFTINQFSTACSFSLSPSSINIGSAGGTATVGIVASGSSCNWGTGVELTVTPTTGTGSASVAVTIPANSTAAPVQQTVTIAGQTLTINQTGVNCTYSLSANSVLFDSTGGSGSVDITAANGCAYNTILGPSWINVTSGASGTGTGSAQTLVYTVDANSTTAPRTGALIIGGQVYAITEQALACSVSVDTSQLGSPFDAAGGSGIIGITTNGANCPWHASANGGFAQLSQGGGFGTTNLTVTVNTNAGSPTARSGSVTISGQTISFTQAGTACTFVLRSTGSNMPPVGGAGNVTVVAPTACSWTAAANDSWLHIVAKGTNGTADVSFTADANSSVNPRSGSLTVAGQTFTVNEGAAPCSYTLASQNSGVLANTPVNNLTVNYTASANSCPAPNVASFSDWIAASSTSYTAPNGTVTYSILANNSGNARAGNVVVGDKVFRVLQTGSNCQYSLNSYGIAVNYLGTSSSFTAAANLGTCTSPPTGSNQPFIDQLSLSGDPTEFTESFTVEPFSSANKTVRTGYITFGGQLFYVKQTSF